ncbi:MAG: hypothetical protein F9K23_16580 [Bacteroidetes bacterium]|nr:MAG: hypothetical protein F9K23_16580 [Bacteroidota bacterium]
MKHTEKEILDIAKDVLRKLEFPYDKSVELKAIAVDKKDNRFSKPTWVVAYQIAIQFTPRRLAFLYIDDETGAPLLIFHSHANVYLTLNEDGTIEKTVKRYGED